MYPYIAPENFENSKISSITNEQLFIKLADLLEQKEISKYITSKEKLISIIEKYCEFFQFSEDKEKIQYVLPEGMTVFSILNIPPKLNKEEVKHHLELVNLQYNRLYKKGFYWYLSTIDKETVICVQNSLRELIFDEIRIKYIHNNKNQILKYMKDKMDKNSYQKDAKYLGINNKYNYNKGKNYDSDSGSFSWRKGSGGSKSSFDYSEKPYKKSKNYKYKRNRFNSDNDGKKYNKYNNNYYKNYGSNNSNISNHSNNSNQEVEIDVTKLKYSLNIKNKYSFGDIKAFYEKYKKNILQKPQFSNESLVDIISDKPKEIVSINELIENNEKNKKVESPRPKKTENEKNMNATIADNNNNINTNINTNIKIPKMNPLSGMSKNFNKFDIVPGNAMPGLMMPFQPSPWIQETYEEE